MKKRGILSIALVFAVLVTVLGAGCVSTPSDPIVGDWVVSSTTIPVVFNNDGTGHFKIELPLIGTQQISLTWIPVEGVENTYSIAASGNGIPVGDYVISDDGKTLKGPITLTKVVE